MGYNQNANIMSIENEIELNVIQMNIEKEIVRTLEQNESLQSKNSKTRDNEKRIQINLQKLHPPRKIWKRCNRNSLCWDIYCVNDVKGVEGGRPQFMKHIFSYVGHVNNLNLSIKDQKKFNKIFKNL